MTIPLRLLLLHPDPRGRDEILGALSLSACRAELRQVHDMRAWIEALEEGSFDALLLLYAPPPSGGSTALAAARHWWPAVPVLAICAPTATEHGHAAVRAGAADYLFTNQLLRLASLLGRVTGRKAAPSRLPQRNFAL